MRKIRVGSRGSRLALAQADIIIGCLKERFPEIDFEIVEIKTTGDKLQEVSLDKIGGKGAFVKEIEEALLCDDIDIAVHSLKDVPPIIHQELMLAVYYKRENPADVLVSSSGAILEELPEGAVVGTSSLRRLYQIRERRDDLKLEPVRGNINTRLRKLEEGQYDALVLAAAGLIRLELQDRITEWLPCDSFIPSPGQGILSVEVRRDRGEIIDILKHCDDKDARIAALSERAFLRTLNGNCKIPVGAYCRVRGDSIMLYGMLGNQDNGKVYKEMLEGRTSDAESLGVELAQRIGRKAGGLI